MDTHTGVGGTGFVCLIVLLGSRVVRAESWPTHRHDAARSGVTSAKVTPPLKQAWIYASRHRPQRAWPGPAKRDGWHKVDNLKPRMVFDWAFHVVMDETAVYFGSSADDQVRCLDAATGRQRWRFFTDGPIRLAPTLSDGRVYVGADDGFVYCLDAADGKLLWKYTPAPNRRRLAGNGRMMSVWPIRTGVLVDDGQAYFGAGLFAFNDAYLCAIRVRDGSEAWKRAVHAVAPQGYILASKTRLYVPTGRGAPVAFNRNDGKFLHALDGSGGAFCVLSDEAILSGPGKTGTLDAFKANGKDQIASFAGNQIVVTAKMSYLHTDTELSALDRPRFLRLNEQRSRFIRELNGTRKALKKLPKEAGDAKRQKLSDRINELDASIARITKALPQCIVWRRPCTYPYSLILASDVLFAGGTNHVAAFSTADGKTLWTADVTGRALDLAAAPGRLVVSTDQGTLHCFQ